MNKVCKYKKSIIFISIIVLTLAFALSFIGLQSREIHVEMDNNEFYYNLEALARTEDITNYPSVRSIATYSGASILPVQLAFSDGKVFLMNSEMLDSAFDYGYIVNTTDKVSKVEVYLITNIIGDVPAEWVPDVNFTTTGDSLSVNVSKRAINVITDSAKDKSVMIKMLIKIS